MDCRTARLLLDYARPRSSELPVNEADALETHLAGCPECESLSRAERQLDAHLSRALCDVPVPDGLRSRLQTRLQAERGDRHRRLLAWGARITAAAAVILVAVWLLLSWHSTVLSDIDPVAFRDRQREEDASTDRDKVERWFHKKYKVTTEAPGRFNYGLLLHRDLAYLEGKRVPMLLFNRGEVWAKVYILSGKEWNLKNLRYHQPEESGGLTVEVWPNKPDNPNFAYLIIHQGNSLAPLLQKEQPAF